jgi:hypothetical protein
MTSTTGGYCYTVAGEANLSLNKIDEFLLAINNRFNILQFIWTYFYFFLF